MERKKHLIPAALFLTIIYTVGRLGLSSAGYSAQFQSLTWLNLVVTAVLTFAFHQSFTRRFLLTCAGIFSAGFLVEWLGVKTGIFFGEYYYGETLGWKLDDIPLLIGLNWLVLIYSVANFLKLWRLNMVLYILAGSAIMVFIDIFLEPFAIHFGLWLWKNNHIPLQNYAGWFVVSAVMLGFMRNALVQLHVNWLAVFVYFLQLAFFISFRFY